MADVTEGHTLIIRAAGRGSRLGELTAQTPKPMLDIYGKPFLHRLIDRYRDEGFTKFIISVKYASDKIRRHYFGEGVLIVKELRPEWEYTYYENKWILNGDTWLTSPFPIRAIPCNEILAYNGIDAGAQMVSLGRLYITPTTKFYDIGTPETLEEFREYYRLTYGVK